MAAPLCVCGSWARSAARREPGTVGGSHGVFGVEKNGENWDVHMISYGDWYQKTWETADLGVLDSQELATQEE